MSRGSGCLRHRLLRWARRRCDVNGIAALADLNRRIDEFVEDARLHLRRQDFKQVDCVPHSRSIDEIGDGDGQKTGAQRIFVDSLLLASGHGVGEFFGDDLVHVFLGHS